MIGALEGQVGGCAEIFVSVRKVRTSQEGSGQHPPEETLGKVPQRRY